MRLVALLALWLAVSCVPSSAPQPPPDAPPNPPAADAGPPAPDPTQLELCMANFTQLNPDVDPAIVQSTFCATPEDLAPWAKQKLLNAHPRALAR